MTAVVDPAAAQASVERSLTTLRATFRARFEAASTEQALRDEHAKVLGKKGELTLVLKQMGQVPPDARRTIGELMSMP